MSIKREFRWAPDRPGRLRRRRRGDGGVELLRTFETRVGDKDVRVLDQAEMHPDVVAQALNENPDLTEYAVPVRWLTTRSIDHAVRAPGLFASQLSACRLRDERTLEVLRKEFVLDSD